MTRKRIGFVLLSNRRNPQPSTRISVLNMFPYLEAAGYDPFVLFEPESSSERPALPDLVAEAVRASASIVYFQKVHGSQAVTAARELSARGIRTVYGVCDFVDNEMAAATDATIAVTEFLKSLYAPALHSRIHVVHDGIERPEARKTAWRDDRGSALRPLRAVLVTAQSLDRIPMLERIPAQLEVLIVGRYPPAREYLSRARHAWWRLNLMPRAGDRISFLASLLHPRITRVAWTVEGAYHAMTTADIGIIPVDMAPDRLPGLDVSSWQVKSENRLTMKMAVGLPVIAAPLPSYRSMIRQGENGYLAESPEEWSRCLDELRDPDLRKVMGERARDSVIHRFSQDLQAAKLLAALDRL